MPTLRTCHPEPREGSNRRDRCHIPSITPVSISKCRGEVASPSLSCHSKRRAYSHAAEGSMPSTNLSITYTLASRPSRDVARCGVPSLRPKWRNPNTPLSTSPLFNVEARSPRPLHSFSPLMGENRREGESLAQRSVRQARLPFPLDFSFWSLPPLRGKIKMGGRGGDGRCSQNA